MRIVAVLIVSFMALALSGCLGNEVTISGQGGAIGTKTKSLDCGGSGTIVQGAQGGGSFNVKVLDGESNTRYDEASFGGGQSGSAVGVTGIPGSWTLKVDFGSTGYGGQYSVTLKC